MNFDLRQDFTIRLRRLRRRMVFACLGRSILTSLPVALLAAVPFYALSGWTVTIPAVIGIALLWAFYDFCHYSLGLRESAKAFDAAFHTNSRVINARELTENGADSVFALHAVAEGAAALAKEKKLPLAPVRIRWGWYLFFLLGAGAALLIHLPAVSGNGKQESTDTISVTLATAADARQGMERPPRRAASGSRGVRSAQESSVTQLKLPRRAAPAAGAGEDAGAVSAPGQGETSETTAAAAAAEQTEPEAQQTTPAAENAAAGEQDSRERTSASGSDSLPGGESGESRQQMQNRFSTLSRNTPKERRQERRKEQNQYARGGSLPFQPDNAPPAGRELSKEERPGDEPGEGRGGPSGEKKSRGTASMLAVTPQPDNVAGRTGSGPEQISGESAPPSENENASGIKTLPAGNTPEPINHENRLPLRFRSLFAQTNKGSNL